MVFGLNVLVVEDEGMIALDLAQAVEAAGGIVIGPVATVREALSLMERLSIDAAILDANLLDRDITPVVTALAGQGKALIMYTASGLPSDLLHLREQITVVPKPAAPEHVLEVLASAIRRVGGS